MATPLPRPENENSPPPPLARDLQVRLMAFMRRREEQGGTASDYLNDQEIERLRFARWRFDQRDDIHGDR